MARLFLDSNVILSGLLSAWTSSHLTLMLCAKGFYRMVTTPYVIEEVENALLRIALQKQIRQAETLLDDYSLFVEIARPEIVALDENSPEI
jgi:predicted nucleic acid-binding protein